MCRLTDLDEVVHRAREVVSLWPSRAGSAVSFPSWLEDLSETKLSHSSNVQMWMIKLCLHVCVSIHGSDLLLKRQQHKKSISGRAKSKSFIQTPSSSPKTLFVTPRSLPTLLSPPPLNSSLTSLSIPPPPLFLSLFSKLSHSLHHLLSLLHSSSPSLPFQCFIQNHD